MPPVDELLHALVYWLAEWLVTLLLLAAWLEEDCESVLEDREMYEIGTHVKDFSRQGRKGRVVAISRSDAMCIVEYADNSMPHTSGWALMAQFTEDPTSEFHGIS